MIELNTEDTQCIDDWWSSQEFEGKPYLKKKLTVENWYVIVIPETSSDNLKKLSCIRNITPDAILENHSTIPNDPEFGSQTDMNLIGMPEAWDLATGGLTIYGDTIVIAVIDDGFQLDHEDLVGNLWHNPQEIAEDGIDNDENGYIDDYYALNTTTGNDNHSVLRHGTSVSGIIGASGNNAIGVSGVNWNVKLMLISYDYHVSGLAEAYQYVVDMRKRYNETKGKEGAFVVAVNLSSGVAFGKPENYPIWCSMYDKLGAEGVLGVCSTSNWSHNADTNGDLPALCPSAYTIIVTNVSPDDELMDNAGYGRLSVDLGAPGEKTWTTDINNSYSYFSGTSAAAPHVAGTVALMYSAACQSFFDSLETNPTSIALRVKNLILTSGTPNATLEGITLSGKRLQTDAALEALNSACEGTHQPKP
ncbi:MAG TPA: S8 family serine peptidase, partial [Saprospiraceae bacterium]